MPAYQASGSHDERVKQIKVCAPMPALVDARRPFARRHELGTRVGNHVAGTRAALILMAVCSLGRKHHRLVGEDRSGDGKDGLLRPAPRPDG
jgi:hypothetical protein